MARSSSYNLNNMKKMKRKNEKNYTWAYNSAYQITQY